MPAPDTRRVTATSLEIRTDGDTATIEGYASTFGHPYSMGWYDEEVVRGAFTKTLSESPDVRYLLNHDGLPLARTASGTLDLAQDSTGLHTRARVNMQRSDVRDAVFALRDGDVDQMSFGFRTIRDEWDEQYTHRSMQELSLANGDVSIVTYPANPNTSVSMRARTIVEAPADELRAAYRAIHEERSGKTISAATQKQLEGVLENLRNISEANEDAVDKLADLLGATPVVENEQQARSGLYPSVVRERLRLAGLEV